MSKYEEKMLNMLREKIIKPNEKEPICIVASYPEMVTIVARMMELAKESKTEIDKILQKTTYEKKACWDAIEDILIENKLIKDEERDNINISHENGVIFRYTDEIICISE